MVYLHSACVLGHIVAAVLNKECVVKCITINKREDATFLIDLKMNSGFPLARATPPVLFSLVIEMFFFFFFY